MSCLARSTPYLQFPEHRNITMHPSMKCDQQISERNWNTFKELDEEN
jgi:hypothetical protein